MTCQTQTTSRTAIQPCNASIITKRTSSSMARNYPPTDSAFTNCHPTTFIIPYDKARGGRSWQNGADGTLPSDVRRTAEEPHGVHAYDWDKGECHDVWVCFGHVSRGLESSLTWRSWGGNCDVQEVQPGSCLTYTVGMSLVGGRRRISPPVLCGIRTLSNAAHPLRSCVTGYWMPRPHHDTSALSVSN